MDMYDMHFTIYVAIKDIAQTLEEVDIIIRRALTHE